MKSKITRGAGFCGLLDYVFDVGKNARHDKDARLIGGNMAGENPRELVAEFAALRRLRPDVERPVWHSSLRLPTGETLPDAKWNEIAQDYLTRIGLNPEHHPHVFVKHNDSHIHIISSRIKFDGSLYYGKNEHLIATKIVQQLEKDHNLIITKGPSYDKDGKIVILDKAKPTSNELNMAERTGDIVPRQRLQDIITEAVKDRPTQVVFERRLTEACVSYRLSSNGYSYQLEGIAFKGSQLGQSFKWAQLQKSIILPEQKTINEQDLPQLIAVEHQKNLFKQQSIHAAKVITWEAERKRREKFRANRSIIYSVGKLSANILPQPFGEAVKFITETMIIIARLNDWSQAHVYKRQVDQFKTQMHHVKATRLAEEAAISKRVQPFVPVSSAPTTVLNQNMPAPQRPPVMQVYGPEATSVTLLTFADKETGWWRALYLKIADRVQQLPYDTIIYQGEAELPPKHLLEVAAAAVKTWQVANPNKAKTRAEAWNLQHPDLASLLAVVAEVNDCRSAKPQIKAATAVITAYPSQIARQYLDYAQEINDNDPAKARALMDICNSGLNKTSNAKEITLPFPSDELSEIRSALNQYGITNGRKR